MQRKIKRRDREERRIGKFCFGTSISDGVIESAIGILDQIRAQLEEQQAELEQQTFRRMAAYEKQLRMKNKHGPRHKRL